MLRAGSETSGSLADELAALRILVDQLQAENARLLRLLKLSSKEAELPRAAQSGWFEAAPGPVHAGSTPSDKVRSMPLFSVPDGTCTR